MDALPYAFSPAGAASYSGLGLTTIKRLLRDGKLEAVKHGRRTLIRRDALERYLRDLPSARNTLLVTLEKRGERGRFAPSG